MRVKRLTAEKIVTIAPTPWIVSYNQRNCATLMRNNTYNDEVAMS